MNRRPAYWLAIVVFGSGAVCCSNACAAGPAPGAGAPQQTGVSAAGAAKSAPAKANSAVPAKGAPAPHTKFRPYDQIDRQLDGIAANRIAIPVDWKADSYLRWNLNAYYNPIQGQIHAESPDGESWVDLYGLEMFVWLDRAHDRAPWGVRDRSGAIHHPNISLPEAMVRYVIAPNRRNARNLRILGYRPVNNLPRAFTHIFPNEAPRGNGICMRVQYELNGSPVDEEFYGFMPATNAIPAQNNTTEYQSSLMLAHSIGAKSGKLESVRPLLGFIATSNEMNPAWVEQYQQIHQAQQRQEQQNIAQSWANIAIAKQLSAQTHASNEASIARAEAGLAQNRAQQNAARSSFSPGATQGPDGFDQYLRGTEHMQDQFGVVSDQYTDYNYHWTDGFGRYAHSDDPNFDPNRILNGGYQQMTPVRPGR